MESLTATRRGALATLLAWWAAPAWSLDAPAGRVMLTITGDIEQRNASAGAQFDLVMLEKLPVRSYATRTPWFPEPRKFTGVLLRDLLAAVGARGQIATAVALNDYRVDIPVAEAQRHDLLVAWLLDDKPMAVRDKGPLVVMYPFDDRPELKTALNYSRAAWQLKQLDVR
jgi:hypothetical protein